VLAITVCVKIFYYLISRCLKTQNTTYFGGGVA